MEYLSGDAIAIGYNNAHGLSEEVIDESSGTYWQSSVGGTRFFLLSCSKLVTVTRVLIQSRQGGSFDDRLPDIPSLYGSHDLTNWTLIESEIAVAEVGTLQTFNFTNTESYVHYKFTWADNIGSVIYDSLSRLELWGDDESDANDVLNDTDDTYTAHDVTYGAAANAGDGNVGTYWQSDGVIGGWFTIQLDTPAVANAIRIFPRNAGYWERLPDIDAIKGSNNGSDWDTLTAEYLGYFPADQASVSYWTIIGITNTTSYEYYKIEFEDTLGTIGWAAMSRAELLYTYQPESATTTTTTTTTSSTTSTTTSTTTTTVPYYVAWDRSSAYGSALSSFPGSNPRNIRMLIEAGDLSNGGSPKQIRIQLAAHDSSDVDIDGCSIGERDGSTDDFASAPTRITFDGGNSGVTLVTATDKWSDWVDFDLDDTKDHLIHIYQGTTENLTSQAVTAQSYREAPATGDDTLEETINYGAAVNFHYFIEYIEIRQDLTPPTTTTSSTTTSSTTTSTTTTTTTPPCWWNDDFTGSNSDPLDTDKWLETSEGTGSVEIQGNKARVATPSGSGNQASTELIQTISGDFDIQIDIDGVVVPSTNGWAFRLWGLIDSTHWMLIQMRYSTSKDWQIGYRNGGSSTYPDTDVRTNDDGRLRLTRTDSTVKAYYDDGKIGSWTELNVGGEAIGSGDITISLQTATWTGYPAATGDFDNFIITGGCPALLTTTTTTTTTSSTTSSTTSTTNTQSTTTTSETTSTTSTTTAPGGSEENINRTIIIVSTV